jgi:hypothetical protein
VWDERIEWSALTLREWAIGDAVARATPFTATTRERRARTRQPGRDAGHRLARGGREREHGRVAERADGRADLEEGGPEVMAPLGNAMRLVDRHQRHGVRRQALHERGVRQTLGRDQHDARAAVVDRLLQRGAVVGAPRSARGTGP